MRKNLKGSENFIYTYSNYIYIYICVCGITTNAYCLLFLSVSLSLSLSLSPTHTHTHTHTCTVKQCIDFSSTPSSLFSSQMHVVTGAHQQWATLSFTLACAI